MRGLRFLRYEGFDANVVRLVDRSEDTPPALGDLKVIDAETGAEAQLTLTPGLAKKLAEARQDLSKRLHQRALGLGIGYQERAIQEPFVDSVLKTLHGGGILEHRSGNKPGEKSWG